MDRILKDRILKDRVLKDRILMGLSLEFIVFNVKKIHQHQISPRTACFHKPIILNNRTKCIPIYFYYQGQYLALYEAFLEAYTCRDCRMDLSTFDAISSVSPEVKHDKPDHEFKVNIVII